MFSFPFWTTLLQDLYNSDNGSDIDEDEKFHMAT